MDTFLDLRTALQSDLNASSVSSLYPEATLNLALNRAYRRAGGLFRWPETEDAKKTSTQNGINYYDYPSNWKPSSIWKLVIDDEDYGDPIAFRDFLYETENDIPSGMDYLWSNQHRRFFIYPTPTSAGSCNISVWGFKVVDELEDDTDITIWSYSQPECNDAVVLEAKAILERKGERSREGDMASLEAKQILIAQWDRIRKDKAKYERTQPFFEVTDFFGQGQPEQITGNFNRVY